MVAERFGWRMDGFQDANYEWRRIAMVGAASQPPRL